VLVVVFVAVLAALAAIIPATRTSSVNTVAWAFPLANEPDWRGVVTYTRTGTNTSRSNAKASWTETVTTKIGSSGIATQTATVHFEREIQPLPEACPGLVLRYVADGSTTRTLERGAVRVVRLSAKTYDVVPANATVRMVVDEDERVGCGVVKQHRVESWILEANKSAKQLKGKAPVGNLAILKNVSGSSSRTGGCGNVYPPSVEMRCQEKLTWSLERLCFVLEERGDMKLSEQGRDLIKRYEGLRLKLYNDDAGHCTIGYGHLMHLGKCDGSEPAGFKDGITKAEAEKLLDDDLKDAIDAVNRCVDQRLAQNEFDALVSFAYNVGTSALCGSNLLYELNCGNSGLAADEFDRWTKAGGKTLPGLVKRRGDEERTFRGR